MILVPDLSQDTQGREQLTLNVVLPRFPSIVGCSAVNGGQSDLMSVVGQVLDHLKVSVGLLHEERAQRWTAVGVGQT